MEEGKAVPMPVLFEQPTGYFPVDGFRRLRVAKSRGREDTVPSYIVDVSQWEVKLVYELK